MSKRIRVTYVIDRYTIADAFRPDPGWGKRVFSVDPAALGAFTDTELEDAAKRTAPHGYRLQKIEMPEPQPAATSQNKDDSNE